MISVVEIDTETAAAGVKGEVQRLHGDSLWVDNVPEDTQLGDSACGKVQADTEPEDTKLEDTKPGDMVEMDSIHLVHRPWGGPFEQ